MEKRRMCPNCRAFITVDDKVCPYCDVQLGAPIVQKRSPAGALGGLIPHAHFTTVLILLINTGMFVATLLRSSTVTGRMSMDLDGRTLLDFGAKWGPYIAMGQWWRLITAGFLHGGLLHILMNSWVLFDLGAQVEENFGTARYLVFYFVSTVTGFLASYYGSASLSIGASAGIFGLIGAMIAMGLRDRSSYGAAVRGLYIRWAIYGFLMGLLPFFNIDNFAHLGGLAGGFVTAYIAGTPGFSRSWERVWQIAAGIAVGATALAFINMFEWLTSQGNR
jgi:rhomboid protease GluP